MAAYHTFPLPIVPDIPTLTRALRAGVDPTIGIEYNHTTQRVIAKKSLPWTVADITTATAIVNAAAQSDEKTIAKAEIDRIPLYLQAIVLLLVDEINILRVRAGLPERTRNQVITAIKNKIDQLS